MHQFPDDPKMRSGILLSVGIDDDFFSAAGGCQRPWHMAIKIFFAFHTHRLSLLSTFAATT